ncbi:heterokaryon incompatibility [Diplodia corticola]|uniref:Heterokaryon incompatibility n=1 Tax=Diplodia corticola TaxID=236234 RepID=A0A1J9QX38_9PEZI|nr:heterokaryon incompatibility [Diplodia corticola]OJD33574.1 heterokaryon incompatibility [Diplodia corticola]
MLCDTCYRMLHHQAGLRENRRVELRFDHHRRISTLREAAESGCSICSALARQLEREHFIDLGAADQNIHLQAALASICGREWKRGYYSLDFLLDGRWMRTFALRPRTSTANSWWGLIRRRKTQHPHQHAAHTHSPAVFELAQRWLSNCKCADPTSSSPSSSPSTRQEQYYPHRLLDLDSIKRAIASSSPSSPSDPIEPINPQTRIHLLETRSPHWQKTDPSTNRYVTLSHTWGSPSPPTTTTTTPRLLASNRQALLTAGIALASLPATFRDAAVFASHLPGVRYLWIDALCVVQAETPTAFVRQSDADADALGADEDWRVQAAEMDRVYRNAYLNISAAVGDGGDAAGGGGAGGAAEVGLFRERNPAALGEDEVGVDVRGLLELDGDGDGDGYEDEYDEDDELDGGGYDRGRGARRRRRRALKACVKAGVGAVLGCLRWKKKKQQQHVKRCSVVDVALWDDLVEDAAVNRRAWVYQERLLAPRVLHFCADGQLAWECSERCCTERYPDGVPGLQLKSGVIVSEERVKDLEPVEEASLPDASLEDVNGDLEKKEEDDDVVVVAPRRLHHYELWKRIVEMYSQKELSRQGDKLMALAGLAKFFFDTKLAPGWPPVPQQRQLPQQHPYVAGMWREYLEVQLLWRVEPRFEDGWIHNGTRRYPRRAPSFSWAALDVPDGVVGGEYRDQNLLFRVEDVQMKYVDSRNKFGLVEGTGCRLLLDARVVQIELHEIEPVFITPYGWWVSGGKAPSFMDMYTDVYLDSPTDDGDVFEAGAKIFCMPASTGEGGTKQSPSDCICLLLQLIGEAEGRRAFKRIGLARLSDYESEKFQQDSKDVQSEKMYLY